MVAALLALCKTARRPTTVHAGRGWNAFAVRQSQAVSEVAAGDHVDAVGLDVPSDLGIGGGEPGRAGMPATEPDTERVRGQQQLAVGQIEWPGSGHRVVEPAVRGVAP